jgi:hypothetical protein
LACHNEGHVFHDPHPHDLDAHCRDPFDRWRVLLAEPDGGNPKPDRHSDVRVVCHHRLAGWLFGSQAQPDLGFWRISRSRGGQVSRVRGLVDPGALVIIGREIAISSLREWMAQIGAGKSVAVHMVGKLKTTVQMVAIPFLLYNGMLFGVIDTREWGAVLILIAAILTIWSMVYYMQKALPEIRARVK